MRNPIAALLGWFLPSRGAHLAKAVPAQPVQHAPRPLPTPRAPRPTDVINADAFPLVRPYLVAFERERDRRTTAARATMCVEFLGASA